MTADQIRTEALRQFAALPRHKPAALDSRFKCYVVDNTLTLGYGKRRAELKLPADWRAAETVDLGTVAQTLLGSA